MSRSKHTVAQIIEALKQAEAGCTAEDVARECGVQAAWTARFGGMDASEVQKVRALADENGPLKRLVADLSPPPLHTFENPFLGLRSPSRGPIFSIRCSIDRRGETPNAYMTGGSDQGLVNSSFSSA